MSDSDGDWNYISEADTVKIKMTFSKLLMDLLVKEFGGDGDRITVENVIMCSLNSKKRIVELERKVQELDDAYADAQLEADPCRD